MLPKAFDDEVFDFYGRALHGRQEQQPRWKRAVAAVDDGLGEAAGELYVERYFPPASKQQMLLLVENLRASYRERIARLPWMSPVTRKVALEKLAAFHPKIGYPDKWRDYSALEVQAGGAFGNVARAAAFDWQRQLKRLGGPTDRGEWDMTPQTINAYYNSTFNEVVFPAAILQPPFFDPYADAAVNYGGIGGVIGHEMGHGFDDQGSKSDARGVLHTWWQPEDTEAFHQRVDALAAQYDTYTVLPGLNINGRLTLGENIGDLGGLSVANAGVSPLAARQPGRRCSAVSAGTSASSCRGRRCGAPSSATRTCARRSRATRTARRSTASTAWCATSTPGTRRSRCNRATSCTCRRRSAFTSGEVRTADRCRAAGPERGAGRAARRGAAGAPRHRQEHGGAARAARCRLGRRQTAADARAAPPRRTRDRARAWRARSASRSAAPSAIACASTRASRARHALEVLTEGVLTRLLQEDPALEGVAAVIFDEFHERSLQADLGLALCARCARHAGARSCGCW